MEFEHGAQDAFEAAESWSVNYNGDVYHDARVIDDRWYYRVSSREGFMRFARQDMVVPICKNLTRKRVSPGWPFR
jgi:hypothetical protein